MDRRKLVERVYWHAGRQLLLVLSIKEKINQELDCAVHAGSCSLPYLFQVLIQDFSVSVSGCTFMMLYLARNLFLRCDSISIMGVFELISQSVRIIKPFSNP